MKLLSSKTKGLVTVEVYDNGDVRIVDGDYKPLHDGYILKYNDKMWEYPWVEYSKFTTDFDIPLSFIRSYLNTNAEDAFKGNDGEIFADYLADFYLHITYIYGLKEIALDEYEDININITEDTETMKFNKRKQESGGIENSSYSEKDTDISAQPVEIESAKPLTMESALESVKSVEDTSAYAQAATELAKIASLKAGDMVRFTDYFYNRRGIKKPASEQHTTATVIAIHTLTQTDGSVISKAAVRSAVYNSILLQPGEFETV